MRRSSVARHIARRLVLVLPTLLGLSLLTFGLLRLVPGDPAQVMLGEHASAAQVARARQEMGLDQPLPVQYARYLGRLLQGDWGQSIKTNLPVRVELGQRLPATLELGTAALLIACVVGIPLGILAAHRPHSPAAILASEGTLVGVSVPLFWLGLLLAYLFGYRLGWLPPSGRLGMEVEMGSLAQVYGLKGAWLAGLSDLLANFHLLNSLLTGNLAAFADALRHLALPALTLSTVPLAVVVRMTRASLQEALAQDYVRTARAKGLPERRTLLGHALRNAWLPVLTVAGLQLGLLLSGAILTEAIFSWPGVGQLVVDRILARDYPVVQGVVLATALLLVLVNLLMDVGYAYLDPRIRYE
jgi:peptide/nickel transport system permease protein